VEQQETLAVQFSFLHGSDHAGRYRIAVYLNHGGDAPDLFWPRRSFVSTLLSSLPSEPAPPSGRFLCAVEP
jgi:hypothetical protein